MQLVQQSLPGGLQPPPEADNGVADLQALTPQQLACDATSKARLGLRSSAGTRCCCCRVAPPCVVAC
jgi:hypothetical protein